MWGKTSAGGIGPQGPKGDKGDKGDPGSPGSGGGSPRYSGKKIYCFGDSITSGGGGVKGYTHDMGLNLGAIVTNYGSSGADSNRFRAIVCGGTASGGTTYPAPDYTNVDVVTMMIGHNQDNWTTTIADISGDDFNLYPDTFYGNVGRAIEHVLNENQNIRIFLLTPIKSTNGRHGPNSAKATPALKEIGAKYSLPVIDLHNISGLNFRNMPFFTGDGHTHPNAAGAAKIGEVLGWQMLSY